MKKTKNTETIPSNMACQWKILSNSGVLYIIRNDLKKEMFSKMLTETTGYSSFYELQNERDYFYHYNEFVPNLDFEIVF